MLHQQRYALFRMGVQPSEFASLTRWQRMDLLYRYKEERTARAKKIRGVPKNKRIWALVQAALARVLFR